MRTDEGKFSLSGSDLFFIAPGVRHSISYPGKYLGYSCKFQADLPEFPRVIHFPDNDYSRGVIQTVKTILETTFPRRFFGVPEGTIILPQDQYQLLMEYYLTGVLAVFRQERELSGILERINRLTASRGRPFFSVAEAAEACGYSCGHFAVLVRRSTGMSARDYLNHRRLEFARRLLLRSGRNINEISAELGFSSQFHFSDFFRRMTGCSPLQFRLKNNH